MLALPLLFLAPLPGGSHAELHPAEADLFLEMPSLQASLEGLGNMPLARLLQEEELRKATHDWIDLAELDGTSVLRELLVTLGVPESCVGATTESLQGIESISVSITGLDRDPDPIEAEIRSLARALEQLEALASQIDARAAQSDGLLPSDLGELGLSPQRSIDPWGQPFVYRPHDEDIGYELFSLGSDRALGGGVRGADVRFGDVLPMRALALAGSRLGGLFVLDFESDQLARSTVDLLIQTLSAQDLVKLTEEPPVDLGHGATGPHVSIDLARAPYAPRLWIARSGPRLVIGWGTVEAGKTAIRSAGKAPSLAADEGYRRAAQGVHPQAGIEVAHGYSRISGFALLRPLVPLEAALASSGSGHPGSTALSVLRWLAANQGPQAWRMVVTDERRLVTESFAPNRSAADGNDATEAWFGTAPVAFASAELVPADAMAVLATSIDGQAIGRAFLDWIETSSPGARAGLQEQLGFDPLQDLFGNLGGELVASCMPVRGLALPKVSIFFDLADAEAFSRALEATAAVLAEKHPDVLRVTRREYHDEPYVMIEPAYAPSGPLAALSPCLAVVQGRLLVTFTSTDVKREIRRLEARAGETPDAEWHPAFSPENEGAYLVASMDWADLILGVESLVRAFGALASGAVGNGFDIASLPSAELITRHLRPTVHVRLPVDGGIRTRHESSFGPETWFGLPAYVVAAVHRLHGGRQDEARDPAPETEETAEGVDPGIAETREVLAELKLGLGTYQVVVGQFPDTLEQLVVGTESFPGGFLDRGELPKDGWDRPFVYMRVAEGYELRSAGPNGIDDRGGADDVNVD